MTLINNSMLLFIFIFNSCTQVEDAKKNLISGDRDLIIESAIWIKKNEVKDSSIVIQLLTHILDSRISTSTTHYMETPYLTRLAALEKVTGKKSPYKVEEKPDALIVDYYLEWAISKGFIKSKGDIDVVPPYVKQVNDSKTFMKHIVNSDKVTWLNKYSWERPPLDPKRFHN